MDQELMNWLKERMNKIEEKVDSVKDDCASINITLERNTTDLEYHIKRTDLLEAAIKPIAKHVTHVEGVLKFVGILSLLGGLALTIMKLMGISNG